MCLIWQAKKEKRKKKGRFIIQINVDVVFEILFVRVRYKKKGRKTC
jgi:hypothetical protein